MRFIIEIDDELAKSIVEPRNAVRLWVDGYVIPITYFDQEMSDAELLETELVQLCRAQKFIQAIKLYRDEHNRCDLRLARDYIADLCKRYDIPFTFNR